MKRSPATPQQLPDADVVLIGAGIMSATLGSMLAELSPDMRIVVLEKAGDTAEESSEAWNNAGTGHSGFCELNYMPDPGNGTKAASIASQFHLSRRWWAHLAQTGRLDPAEFIHSTIHMNLVFGESDVDYLRQRVETLRADPLFADTDFTTSRSEIAQWAPLTMEGRTDDGEPIAAARNQRGTDVDFGALTRGLLHVVTEQAANEILTNHEVTGLRATKNGWAVSGKTANPTAATRTSSMPTGDFVINAKHVFVGAGGFALKLLQKSGIPEVRGYAVLPVGASFYRSATPSAVDRHNAKVYGQAAVGAPPMSVPHLDKRIIDEEEHLLFGPYATFSTKLLKNGHLSDFFTTLRADNLHVIAAAGLQNLDLVKFLIKELAASPKKKFAQLARFYPKARFNEWTLVPAGQRAQLVKPDPKKIGVLQQGTELVVGADGSIAGLLGASPGASTAVPIMLDLLRSAFPAQWHRGWKDVMSQAIPDIDRTDWDAEAVAASSAASDLALGLGTSVRN
ncbi:malate:quinone oxidoreductase [Brevibacterium aurantiacum]|uniref:Probable malate:quinone oxidoreductase n=1 Tax=Brevibacterium aurantiacum TaxID=273384 RepID=A0A2H1IB63_BREAU|nr:malate:quinone oxidoreductase [Brevibacterium aurantiacum]PCC48069.1 malate:quinone oxidoreductase [Brevibacterium aurantiacum]PCC57979.1 malate:quinone oxidoreductase [Brevibacterium aurantiacum]SMX72437.1 malate dehydrogenase (quinone) [Brevibacterium aurantiacum]SMX93573.1 malate dehydrogenase (quinone) [Brevibacterium aurantiacum]